MCVWDRMVPSSRKGKGLFFSCIELQSQSPSPLENPRLGLRPPNPSVPPFSPRVPGPVPASPTDSVLGLLAVSSFVGTSLNE